MVSKKSKVLEMVDGKEYIFDAFGGLMIFPDKRVEKWAVKRSVMGRANNSDRIYIIF